MNPTSFSSPGQRPAANIDTPVPPSTGERAKPPLSVQAFWLMAARTVAFVLTLALPILMVRLFDKGQFGTYRLALVFAATVNSVLQFGVGVSAFYFLPRFSEIKRKQLIFNIVFYEVLVAAAVVAVSAIWPGILTHLLGTDSLTPIAITVGLMIALNMFAGFAEIVATANQDVWHSAALIVGAQASRGVLIVAAAFWFRTVEAVLWAWIIQAVAQSAVLVWYLHKRFPHFWRYKSRDTALEQAKYAVPLGLTSLVTILQLDIHNYIVSNSFDTATYALYAVGTAQVPLIGLLRESLNAVMQARMSKLQQDNDTATMLNLMLRTWRVLGMACLPIFAGLMLVSREFIIVLYRTEYLGSVSVFRLNLFLIIASLFITDAAMRSLAHRRMWLLRNRIFILILQIALSLPLMRAFGINGVLLGLIITLVIDRVLNVRLVFQELGFGRQHLWIFRDLARLAVISGVAALIVAGMLALLPDQAPLIRLTMGISVYAVSYLAILIGTGSLSAEENDLLNRFVAKALRTISPKLAARINAAKS